MFRSFGPMEILLILGIVMLLFGAARMPAIGNSLGRSFREFKNGITGSSEDAAPTHKKPQKKGDKAERYDH